MSKHHFRVGITGKGTKPPVCLGCQRPIVYGDRCHACAQELRRRQDLRRRRKR